MIKGKGKNKHLGGCIAGGDSRCLDKQLVQKLVKDFNIKTIVDIGCGTGQAIGQFIEQGVEAIGVEGLYTAIELSEYKDSIIKHDYTEGRLIMPRYYDACWCVEFVEHVDEKYLENILHSFMYCKHIFMTHALPGQSGYHHVNCKNDDYWIDKLKIINYNYNKEYSWKVRKKTNAEYIKQSFMLFTKKDYIWQ